MLEIIGGLIALLGAVFAIFNKGKASGKSSNEAKVNREVLENVQKAKQVDERVGNKSDDIILDELLKRSRDSKK